MSQDIDSESKAQSVRWTKKVLFGLGLVFVTVGIIRQWPILGKSYMEFIEGVDTEKWFGFIKDWIGVNKPYKKGYWLDDWNSYSLSIRVVVWMQQFTPEVVNTHLQQLITHAGTDWQFHQRYEPSNIQGKRGVLMFQNIIL